MRGGGNAPMFAAAMAALALGGRGLPVFNETKTYQMTPEECAWFNSLDQGGRRIWLRRFQNGLTPAEHAFVQERAAELKGGSQ